MQIRKLALLLMFAPFLSSVAFADGGDFKNGPAGCMSRYEGDGPGIGDREACELLSNNADSQREDKDVEAARRRVGGPSHGWGAFDR